MARNDFSDVGTRVEQGICYELDQTDKESNPTGLSIYLYTRKTWLCIMAML